METKSFVVMPTARKGEEKKNPKAPDYVVKRAGDWVEIGICWKKLDKEGRTFLSCVAKEPKPDYSKEEKSAKEEFNSITPSNEI